MSQSAVEKWLLEGDGSENSRSVSDEQRNAVTFMGNTVTAAGAGSGKTFVLARRFAYLVCIKKYKVSQILTLTFTKKATTEMYSRIYKTLFEIATKFDDPYAKEAVAEFFTTKIQTLDSYCSYIVRQKSYAYGIKPDFVIDNEMATDLAKTMALPFVLTHRNNFAIQELARTNSLEQLADEIFVQTVLNYSKICEPVPFRNQFFQQQKYALEKWDLLVTQALDLIRQLQVFSQENGSKKKTAFFTNLAKAFLEPCPEKKEYINFCLYVSKFSFISLQGQKADSNPCVSLVKDLKSLYSSLSGLASFLSQQDLINHLVPLLEEFQDDYLKQKRKAGVLTFSDSAYLALRILQENYDVRQMEKETYKAIMIDEFQDDNNLQKEMLFCLAEKLDTLNPAPVTANNLEKSKLFFVGDEKQSIYRFRGADVSVFRSLANELQTDGAESVSPLLYLSCNYRSHPDLIKSFNEIFGGNKQKDEKGKEFLDFLGVFKKPEANGDFPIYEAEYTEVLAGKKIDIQEKKEKRLKFCFFNEEESAEDERRLKKEECEAVFVAQEIRKLIDLKKANPQDIALLFRTKTHQHYFEKHLRLQQIPYSTDSMGSFFSDAPTNDIYNFLKLCLYPKDIVAYSVFLRSPFIALSCHSLELLLCQKPETIFDEKVADILPAEEKAKYLLGCELYKNIAQTVGIEPITATISKLWYELGYRYETLWNDSVQQYSQLYDFLFEMARKADLAGKSMASFLDSLSALANNELKLNDLDIPLERGNAVQLMTIHASKGLEFPVVFVCCCHGRGIVNKNPKAVYYSKKWGVTLNLPSPPELVKAEKNYFYSVAKEMEDKEEEAELRRLLYVAMTRAESYLYVTGSCKFPFEYDEEDKICCSFLNLLSPLICACLVQSEDNEIQVVRDAPFVFEKIPASYWEKDKTSDVKIKNTLSWKKNFADYFSPYYKELPPIETPILEWPYKSPSHLESVEEVFPKEKPIKNNLSIQIDELIGTEKGGEKFLATDFGSVAHLYLEAFINKELVDVPASLVLALNKKQQEILDSVCSQLAKNFCNSAIGKEAQNATWIRTEFGFYYKIGKYILRGSIDLIYKRADGGYAIIDYKTNASEQPEIYYLQLAAYRKAMAAIFSIQEEKISCGLFYLRTGNFVDITDCCAKIDLGEIIALGKTEE